MCKFVVECSNVQELKFLCEKENIVFSQSYEKIFEWVSYNDHICVNLNDKKWGRKWAYEEEKMKIIKFKDFYKEYNFNLVGIKK